MLPARRARRAGRRRVAGDPERPSTASGRSRPPGPRDLSFLTDPTLPRRGARRARAGALLVGPSTQATAARTCWSPPTPDCALASCCALFHPRPRRAAGVHPTAVVGPGARIDAERLVGRLRGGRRGQPRSAPARCSMPFVVRRRAAAGSAPARCSIRTPCSTTAPRSGERVRGPRRRGAGRRRLRLRHARRRAPQGAAGRPGGGRGRRRDRRQLRDRPRHPRRDARSARAPRSTTSCRSATTCGVGRRCILCGQAGIAGSATLGDGVVLAGQAGVAGPHRARRRRAGRRPSRRCFDDVPSGDAGGRHPGDRSVASGGARWRCCSGWRRSGAVAALERRRPGASSGGVGRVERRAGEDGE